MLAPLVYLLGAIVSLLCAGLLLRAYAHGKVKLLLWSGLCFAGLTVSNVLLFIDLSIYQEVDLYLPRLATAAFSMLLLLYGLVFESE